MIVALCSLKGSPGVTTLSVALASGWPSGGQPVVVECDRAGGDLLARFRLDLNPGLVTLAAAARRAGGDAGLIWQHTQRLPGGLPVVAGPPGADQARAALAELTADPGLLPRAAARPGVVVVADCGRVGENPAALAVVRTAQVMLLVTRATDDALAHLAVSLPAVASWSPRPRLVLVGDGYRTDEIDQELGLAPLGIEIAGRIPQDPDGAAAFSGWPARRSPARSRLGQAAAAVAARTAQEAGVPPPPETGSGPPTRPRPAGRASRTDEFTAPARYEVIRP